MDRLVASLIEGVPTIPLPIELLLNTCSDLFMPPTGLPLTRPTNHCITLLLSTHSVNVRPYCYAHTQKAKLEHQVDDMLAVDVIRHSSSPFFALALLVHKANGIWRFYMDYRGLN